MSILPSQATVNNNWYEKIRTFNFWENNLTKVWVIGIILRIMSTLLNLSYIDFNHFRLPIAKRLASGEPAYIPITSESLSVNNHMPIYPYISVLMYLLASPFNSDLFMGLMIKLPLAIGDGLIPIVIYLIAKRLDYERIAVSSSAIYALNPMTMQEVSYAHWDGLANLFVLLAILFILYDRPYMVGLLISIGFFTKQFPLFFLGVVCVYWRNDMKKLLKVGFSFSSFGVILLALVLLPYGTSLSVMYESITYHPIYQGETQMDAGEEKTPSGIIQYTIQILRFLFGGDFNAWKVVWMIILAFMLALPLVLFMFNPEEENIIAIVIIQLILLSVFFISIHDQFLIWPIPLLGFWLFKNEDRRTFRVFIYCSFTLLYFARKLDIFYFTDPLLAIIGIIVILDLLKMLAQGVTLEDLKKACLNPLEFYKGTYSKKKQ
ncbi:MAG: DUF2029 domain-containing protein [Candidatus Heimdallarchaeota archaeon]|nr:DUF2029 domain-containing protein [Candidatus Heimdallarchaeota archaeon]MCK5048356.1 DUF2029 domain-containing protein [Candidatus Heimdallarchaeota archaeon]